MKVSPERIAVVMTARYSSPYPPLQRARQLRTQVSRLLAGHQHPDQTRELYVIGARSVSGYRGSIEAHRLWEQIAEYCSRAVGTRVDAPS